MFNQARRNLEKGSDLGKVETVSGRALVWALRLLVKPLMVCLSFSLVILDKELWDCVVRIVDRFIDFKCYLSG